MLNNGGIKLSTCQSLTSKLRGCLDAGPRGIPHVARFIQQRIEHQRDRQKNRTQPWALSRNQVISRFFQAHNDEHLTNACEV